MLSSTQMCRTNPRLCDDGVISMHVRSHGTSSRQSTIHIQFDTIHIACRSRHRSRSRNRRKRAVFHLSSSLCVCADPKSVELRCWQRCAREHKRRAAYRSRTVAIEIWHVRISTYKARMCGAKIADISAA